MAREFSINDDFADLLAQTLRDCADDQMDALTAGDLRRLADAIQDGDVLIDRAGG